VDVGGIGVEVATFFLEFLLAIIANTTQAITANTNLINTGNAKENFFPCCGENEGCSNSYGFWGSVAFREIFFITCILIILRGNLPKAIILVIVSGFLKVFYAGYIKADG
jgi:hypothetical protein